MADLAVQHLLQEHREIEKVLAELESLLDAYPCAPHWTAASSEAFARVALCLGRELVRHMSKEEEILFPALEEFLPRDVGPLTVLRGEHADLTANFSRMRQAGESLDEQNRKPDTMGAFQRSGRATIQIMRDHIYKEDHVLFPLVARFLPPELDAELLQRMEAVSHSEAVRGLPERERPMNLEKKEMIDKLKLEISVLRDGGYNPSVREPRKQPRLFRDSVICLNMGLEEGLPKKEPCTNCVFSEFVPPEHRDEEYPCHHIPLNSGGDTVASLQSQGDRDKLAAALLTWLYNTVARLEEEVAKEESFEFPTLSVSRGRPAGL